MSKRSAATAELENQLQEILSPSGGLTETRWVSKLIDLMLQVSDLEGRSILISALLNTNQSEKTTFSRFVQLGGVEILGTWIDQSKHLDDQESKQLIQSILSSLNKLCLSKEILQRTNIGNILNGLKNAHDISIQVKASSILSRWEKINSEEMAYKPREPTIEMNKKMKFSEDISKNVTDTVRSKKTVRWASEDRIEAPKYFWRSDEPNSQCATLRPIPDITDTAFNATTVEDFRRKESQMEKELNRKEKIREYSIKHILDNMTPKVLYKDLISKKYAEVKKVKCFRVKNLETAEMAEETRREQTSFRPSYLRESDIPRIPCDDFRYSYAEAIYMPSQKLSQAPIVDVQMQNSMMMPNNTVPCIMPGNVMDPNYLNMMMMSQTPSMPMYFPKMLLNNSNTKPVNYRTEACKNFHSAAGCTHGDACHFIHDFTYEGRPIPNMAEWRRNNTIRTKNMETMKSMQIGFPSYYPPASEPHLR